MERIEERLGGLKNPELSIANLKEMNIDCEWKMLNSVYSKHAHLIYCAVKVPCFTETMKNVKKARKAFQKMDEKQNVWSSSLGSYHMSYPGKRPEQKKEGPLFESV